MTPDEAQSALEAARAKMTPDEKFMTPVGLEVMNDEQRRRELELRRAILANPATAPFCHVRDVADDDPSHPCKRCGGDGAAGTLNGHRTCEQCAADYLNVREAMGSGVSVVQ